MKRVLLVILCLAAQPLWAGNLETELADIQHRWAEIQYQVPEDQKEKAFEGLASEAEQFVAHYPDRAEPLIWQGIVLSTYAGAKGGLGALGLVKDARKSLEAALAIDPEALDGSAYTSLGSLAGLWVSVMTTRPVSICRKHWLSILMAWMPISSLAIFCWTRGSRNGPGAICRKPSKHPAGPDGTSPMPVGGKKRGGD